MDTDGGDYPGNHLNCHLFCQHICAASRGADVLFCAYSDIFIY